MTDSLDIHPRSATSRETANLSFAAYAYMDGLRVIKATETRSRNGNLEYRFMFDDPHEKWDKLHFDFTNSEAARYDNAVRTLKQLCRRNGH